MYQRFSGDEFLFGCPPSIGDKTLASWDVGRRRRRGEREKREDQNEMKKERKRKVEEGQKGFF